MKVVFLGTNGWYDSSTGYTICILIETGSSIILLDAGSGLHKADAYIKGDKPVHLFLSHLHLDHIIGLHLLNKFDIPGGLSIYFRKGDRHSLETIVAPPYSLPFSSLHYPVRLVEVDEREIHVDDFAVQFALMKHSVPTIGFRFEIDGKIVTYCPDTGYCENAVRLAGNADLLIAECAFRPGEESELWPHLNPETAAKLARDAGAKKLALVHFDAFRYQDRESRLRAEAIAQEACSVSVAAMDGLECTV